MIQNRAGSRGLSRRQLFAATGGSILGAAVLAACDSGGPGEESELFANVPDSDLGNGEINFRHYDSGDQKAQYFRGFYSAYANQYDNVSFDYQAGNWDTLQEALTLALRNGTEPDLFNLPPGTSMTDAVDQGYIGAWDDIIDDFEGLQSRVPPGTFSDGITGVDGKTYLLPFSSSRRSERFTIFNTDYMERADEDLTQVMDWDEFRRVMRKVTDQGDGDYYGLILGVGQGNILSTTVSTLAEMAGVHCRDGQNLLTGGFNFDDPILEEAMEFMLALQQDGCIVPGVASMNSPEALARFPQGAAAVTFGGAWVWGEWLDGRPDLPVDINILPQRDTDDVWPQTQRPEGLTTYVHSAQTEYGNVLTDIWHYLYSEEGQMALATIGGAADPVFSETAMEEADMREIDRRAYQYIQEYTTLRPSPSRRSPDVQRFQALLDPVSPNFSDVCIGLFTGQLTDIRAEFRDLQSRTEQNFEETLAEAQSRGYEVDESMWQFPDWNPREDYAIEDDAD